MNFSTPTRSTAHLDVEETLSISPILIPSACSPSRLQLNDILDEESEIYLQSHQERWAYQSGLAGRHRQPMNVLDLSHRQFPIQALSYGIPKKVAANITDFRFSIGSSTACIPTGLADCNDGQEVDNLNPMANISSAKKENILPFILDIIGITFPVLMHLTLEDDSENDATNIHCKSHNNSQEKTQSPSRSTSSNPNEEKSNSEINDYEDIEILQHYEYVKKPHLQHEESTRIQRLYILYRLPNLVSINGVLVTDEEQELACPTSPIGYKVNENEWKRLILDLMMQDDSTSEGYHRSPLQYFSSEEEEQMLSDEEVEDQCIEISDQDLDPPFLHYKSSIGRLSPPSQTQYRLSSIEEEEEKLSVEFPLSSHDLLRENDANNHNDDHGIDKPSHPISSSSHSNFRDKIDIIIHNGTTRKGNNEECTTSSPPQEKIQVIKSGIETKLIEQRSSPEMWSKIETRLIEQKQSSADRASLKSPSPKRVTFSSTESKVECENLNSCILPGNKQPSTGSSTPMKPKTRAIRKTSSKYSPKTSTLGFFPHSGRALAAKNPCKRHREQTKCKMKDRLDDNNNNNNSKKTTGDNVTSSETGHQPPSSVNISQQQVNQDHHAEVKESTYTSTTTDTDTNTMSTTNNLDLFLEKSRVAASEATDGAIAQQLVSRCMQRDSLRGREESHLHSLRGSDNIISDITTGDFHTAGVHRKAEKSKRRGKKADMLPPLGTVNVKHKKSKKSKKTVSSSEK